MDKFRLKFPRDKQRKFLEEIINKSSLNTEKLAKVVGVSGRTFRDWRREKFTLPYIAAKKLTRKFKVKLPLPVVDLRQEWEDVVREAAREGGIACYKKYGRFSTPEGCRKGGLNSLRKRYGGFFKPFFAPKLSEDLAEFTGILLGDGGLTKEQWFITVNSIADAEYAKFLIKLTRKLFKFTPSLYKRKDSNALVLCGSGKKSIKFFTEIGLKVGNKVKQQVGIPGWIKRNRSFCLSCLRGLMDTDGGVFKHQYWINSKKYSYPKICFSNRSLPILRFVFDNLRDLGLSPKIITKMENKKVWLYNQNEVKIYLDKVGSHNPRLLKYWKVSRTAQGMVC